MSPPFPSIAVPPLPVESSTVPPSVDYNCLKGGHKERDDFVILLLSLPPPPAPPPPHPPTPPPSPPLAPLHCLSRPPGYHRRLGGAKETRSIPHRGAPPSRCSCSPHPGGEMETRSIACLIRWRVAARPPFAALICVVREAQRRLVRSRVSFDCTSWPAPLPPHLLFASSGRRKGDSFDRASRRAPPRAFERLLGGGTQGERVVSSGLVGGGWGDDGRDGNGFFIVRGACEYARVWGKKKPKAKFARCSGMGKLCPHATASPKSPRKHAEAADNCAVGAEWGGGGSEQNGQESAPPEVSLAQNRFLVFLESAGRRGPSKKKKRGRQQDRDFDFGKK